MNNSGNRINPLADMAMICMKQHKEAVGQWQDGKITDYWEDPDRSCICVRYGSGRWWHYRQNEAGEMEWW